MLALQIKIVPVLSIYALCSLVPIWCARLFGVKDYTSYKVSWCRSGVILIFTVNQPQKLSSVRNSEREGQTLAANHDNLHIIHIVFVGEEAVEYKVRVRN